MTDQIPPTSDFGAEPTVPLSPQGQRYAGPFASPGSPTPKKSKKHLIGYPATALVALAIGAAGGGAGSATPAAPPTTLTVTQTISPPQPAVTVTQTVRETVTATAAPKAAVPTAAAKVTVPNGVGLNYQQAQDLWRGTGLVVGPAVDATGANRLPVIDSNWVVLSQDLKAGTEVAAGTVITATVKKYTDN